MSTRKHHRLKLYLLVTAGLSFMGVLCLGGCLARQRMIAGKAMKSGKVIETTLSAPDSYTPSFEDPIPEERLLVFLAVRSELAPYCRDFSRLQNTFTAVDLYAEQIESSERPPSRNEAFQEARKIGSAVQSMLHVAPMINVYGVHRNDALLRHGMGLGEFTFINVVACFSARRKAPAGFFGPGKGAPIWQARVAGQIRDMVGRRAAWIGSTLSATPPGAKRDLLEHQLKIWKNEYEFLTMNPHKVAFADGLPDEVRRVIDAHQAELDELCCPATSELDVARVVRSKGIWYDHR